MMHDMMFILAGVSCLSVAVFVLVAFLWVKKLRDNLFLVVTEQAHQQLRNAQRLADTVAQMQKQQRGYEDQIQTLALANKKLWQEFLLLADHLDPPDREKTLSESEKFLH